MSEHQWIRCCMCNEFHNLAHEEDGVDYMTFYGTPELRHRVDLGGKQPYASVRCLCTPCIKAIKELPDAVPIC